MDTHIEPNRLYPIEFMASVAGVSTILIYKSINGGYGRSPIPLPPVCRLGRTIRFRGGDILAWLDALAGAPAAVPKPERLLLPAIGQRRGRPRNATKNASEVI